MTPREERGLVIAALCKLTKKEDSHWLVPSQTSQDKKYLVDVGRETCTCPDHQETGVVCKHIYAVRFTLKREVGDDSSVTETRTLTFAEKKTYTQDWPAYNLAQTTEKHRFQVLLRDLCEGIPEPPRPKTGRRPVPIADRLFAACYKVYSTISTRRFACDLNDAHKVGFLSRPLHCNKVCCFLENLDLTAPLHTMLAQSSLPLRAIETQFAADSTGFSTGRHVRWLDEKYGIERSGHDWVKVHAAVGTKTHIITAAAIYGRDANDCPILPELVKRTCEKGFKPKEWSADKGYLSVENIETIFSQGALPFIAFKSNSTGGAGGLFEKVYHYYQFHRDEYMDHYHRRSNVESVFSAVKRKFGDYIRSRTDVAMRNEALAKLVVYNITSVIHSQCELGIDPVFWLEKKSQVLLADFP